MISSKDLVKERILIVGSNGMLGQRLVEFYKSKHKIELLTSSVEDNSFINDVDYQSVDITRKEKVKKLILDFCPDFIINASGFTNVDACETNREMSWKVNVKGVEYLAQYSRVIDSKMIHISTDYIFDGKEGPYTENNTNNPISYYGRTKLAGENELRISGSKFTILRINVLYGPSKFGKPDFVRWVINSLRGKKQIKIVNDQFNNPTFTDDVVQAVSKAIEFNKEGIYNIGGPELLSRLEFTERIADYFDLDKSLITPVKTADFNFAAKRPLKSGLIILKAQTELNYKPHTIETTFSIMKEVLSL